MYSSCMGLEGLGESGKLTGDFLGFSRSWEVAQIELVSKYFKKKTMIYY